MSEEEEIQVFFEEESGPAAQRMIVIKILEGGDIHAEDNDGQMIVARPDGKVKTFLHGDTAWVEGELGSVNTDNIGPVAWDIIGFYLGITDGFQMGRVRDGRVH